MKKMKKKTYYIFLSSERDIKINNDPIQECLNTTVLENFTNETFECIKKEKIQVLKEQMPCYHHCFLVVDANVEADAITYWQVGYACGKGIKVIGYNEGRAQESIILQEDLKELIGHICDSTEFIKIMSAMHEKLNWNDEKGISEKM